MMKNLWNDEAGFIVSAELVLVATILVIGMITGLTSVRDAVITELADVGGAIGAVNRVVHGSLLPSSWSRRFVSLADWPVQRLARIYVGNRAHVP